MSGLLSIENYVPHRGAMLLLDRLLEAGPEHAITRVYVAKDGPFLEDGRAPAWVGIEYMAQTVAAWAGFQALQNNMPVKIGFLLGTRKFEALQPWFVAGSVLRVEARCELRGSNGLGVFSCQVYDNEALAARAQISVYEPEDGAALVMAPAAGGGKT